MDAIERTTIYKKNPSKSHLPFQRKVLNIINYDTFLKRKRVILMNGFSAHKL